MFNFKSFKYFCLLFLVSCGGGGGGSSEPIQPPAPAALDFSVEAPTTLEDYQAFQIIVNPQNLQSGETVTLSLTGSDNN